MESFTTKSGQQLRRKDKFKEFLYKVHYPDLPLFRIRSDQCKVVGTLRAGSELAGWISSIVEGKLGSREQAATSAKGPPPTTPEKRQPRSSSTTKHESAVSKPRSKVKRNSSTTARTKEDSVKTPTKRGRPRKVKKEDEAT